jgi:hypothetical protein
MRLIANLIAQILREDYRTKKYFRENHVNKKHFDKMVPLFNTLLTSFIFK